eukprot:15485370-Alexandrium_andersonii.AAC.1
MLLIRKQKEWTLLCSPHTNGRMTGCANNVLDITCEIYMYKMNVGWPLCTRTHAFNPRARKTNVATTKRR